MRLPGFVKDDVLLCARGRLGLACPLAQLAQSATGLRDPCGALPAARAFFRQFIQRQLEPAPVTAVPNVERGLRIRDGCLGMDYRREGGEDPADQ